MDNIRKRNEVVPIVIIVLCLFFEIHAAIPPYLATATALSETSIKLTWNSNKNSQILIYQKMSNDSNFVFQTSVLHKEEFCIEKLIPQTNYYFKLRGIPDSTSDTSSFSNTDSVTTQKVDSILKKPSVNWKWDNIGNKPIIIVCDSSSIEQGYRVYCARLSENPFLLKDTLVPNPHEKDIEIHIPFTHFSHNTWYTCFAVVYNENDTVVSESDTLFCLDNWELLQKHQAINLKEKIGELSIYYNTTKNFAIKRGDSIIVLQVTTADTAATVINISDPYDPQTNGTFYIPLVNKNLYCFNDSLLYLAHNLKTVIYKYCYGTKGFVFLDSLTDIIDNPSKYSIASIHKNNNNAFVIILYSYPNQNKYYYTLYHNGQMQQKHPNYIYDQHSGAGHCASIRSICLIDDIMTVRCAYTVHGKMLDAKTITIAYQDSSNVPKQSICTDSLYWEKSKFSSKIRLIDNYVFNTTGFEPYQCAFSDSVKKIVCFIFENRISIYSFDEKVVQLNNHGTINKTHGCVFSIQADKIVVLPINKENYTIRLYALNGRSIYNQSVQNKKKYSVDIGKLAKGIYCLVYNDKSTTRLFKFCKIK